MLYQIKKTCFSLSLLLSGLLVVGLLALPIALAQTSSLIYETHNPGICSIRLRNEDMGVTSQHNINVRIELRDNNKRIVRIFDGGTQLPPDFNVMYGEIYTCRQYGLTHDYPGFWDLVNTGYIEKSADYCVLGASDPTPYDGIENYKCEGICPPNDKICIDTTTLHRCTSDGQRVNVEECDYGCENDACLDPDYNLYLELEKEIYIYGQNITVKGKFVKRATPEEPIEGAIITGKLIKSGSIFGGEVSATTNYMGEYTLVFKNVNLLGVTDLKVETMWGGKIYDKSKTINLIGEPISFEVTTFSYTQYDTEPISFEVRMKDSRGVDIYPEKISELRPLVSLSQGIVESSEVEYKGEGLYEITSIVGGTGVFVGKIEFIYQGTRVSSPTIEINVEKIKISIDTSAIEPTARLEETHNYTIRIYDSAGNKLTPDNLWVEVAYPDGFTTETITYDEFTKIEEGVYSFGFNFVQVEKHTFDIYADKSGYVRGSSRASVSVAGKKPLTAGPKWFSYLPWITIGFFTLFFIFAYILYKKRK